MDPLTEMLHSIMPFTATLGMRGVKYDPSEVRIEMDHAAGLTTMNQILHSGAVMALADAAASACAFYNLPDDGNSTTIIESKANFFHAVADGTVTAVAKPLHAGSMTVVVETEILQGELLVAKAIQTQAVLR